MRKIAVLTYNQKHRKTYDTLALLKCKGYNDVTVYAQPMKYEKKRWPLVKHRPDLVISIPEPEQMCSNLGYEYIEGDFKETINDGGAVFLLCGAGILPEEFVMSHRIINSHPGYTPYARGLDAYKWSVYYNLPIGVTTHLLGWYVDAGEVIERRKIRIEAYDTFHSVAQRVYENEIDMLVGAIDKIDDEHEIVIPGSEPIFKRMGENQEQELFIKFEAIRKGLLGKEGSHDCSC